jgi:hypothetical protein
MAVAPKFSFAGVDIQNINPDTLPLGTNQQDCSLIANVYERGAHNTPTEAAVFATLSRVLQNKKQLSSLAAQSLSSYKIPPMTTGAAAGTAGSLAGLNLMGNAAVLPSGSSGSKLLDLAKNCIPCDLRLISKFELHPNINLLGIFEDFIKNSIGALNQIISLLGNIDAFGDFCSLLNMLSFMCIADLQRIIVMLMAQFLLGAVTMDGMIGLLQALIIPLFAPLLSSITSLLDQLSQLVVGPLKCVIDVINATLRARSLEAGYFASTNTQNDARATALGGSLAQLNLMITMSVATIEGKLAMYTNQIKAMLRELSAGDTAYLAAKLQALNLVRMIAFVVAIIAALMKGHAACNTSKSPEQDELNNFFSNFLNPSSSFNVYVDPNGQLQLTPKVPVSLVPLSADGNVLQLEGQPLIELPASVPQKLPCKLTAPSQQEAAKLANWISELNNLGA